MKNTVVGRVSIMAHDIAWGTLFS